MQWTINEKDISLPWCNFYGAVEHKPPSEAHRDLTDRKLQPPHALFKCVCETLRCRRLNLTSYLHLEPNLRTRGSKSQHILMPSSCSASFKTCTNLIYSSTEVTIPFLWQSDIYSLTFWRKTGTNVQTPFMEKSNSSHSLLRRFLRISQ